MSYTLIGAIAIALCLMLAFGQPLLDYYRVRRRSRTLEKYIGSDTPFGELVSLLTMADMAANGEVEIGNEKLLDTHQRIAVLTRQLVLTGGRKNLRLHKELRRMGYPLHYTDHNRHIYRLSRARISIIANPTGS